MHNLWDEPSSEQPGQPGRGEEEQEAQTPLQPDSAVPTREQATAQFPALQQALWQLTIGGAVQEGNASRPSHTNRLIREQVEQGSLHTLSDEDLLALLLNTETRDNGIVQRIHTLVAGHSLVELLQADMGELQKELGPVKAAQLKGLLEMARRLTMPAPERYAIKSVNDAASLLMPDMAYLDHEQLRVLVLNTQNHVVANMLLYQGTINSSVVRTSEIFRPAVTRKCASIIIAHNHPSGIVTPSDEDIQMTLQCVEAGRLLEIDFLDHLIIGNQTFLSLKERIRW